MRRTITTLASLAAVTALLAGCTQPILEAPDPQSAQSAQSGAQSEPQSGAQVDPVTLTADQVGRIVAEIQTDLDEATATRDPSILERRVSNPALAMREGQFVRAEKTGTDIPPLVIDPQVFSATAGTSWPRVLLVASNASGDDPAEVYLMTQQDARDSYHLENWTRLIGGTSVKGVGIRDGSKVLAPDATGLRMTPQDVLATYINYLNSPDNAEYQVFEDNVFAPRYREELDAVNEAVQVAGNVKATAAVSDYPVIGVSLNNGDALVSTAFTYETVYSRTVPRSAFEMAGTPAAYLDNTSVIGSITVNYLVTVFFLVPEAGSEEPVAVVGSERVITSVSRDDTEPTETEPTGEE